MAEVALAASLRSAQGSSNSRRLRASGHIPGVVYGHGIDPTAVSVESKALRLALNTEAGLNALISLDVEGTKHLALTKSIQKHPVRNTVSHIDFVVVGRNEVMTVEVPFSFIGEAEGVTKQGGLLEHVLNTLTISSTPSNIPSHIEVDISNLQIDESIRVGDISLPSGVTTEVDAEEAIIVAKMSRVALEVEEADAEAEATAEAAGEGESTEESGDDAAAETEEK